MESTSSVEETFEAKYGIPLEYAQGSLFEDEPSSSDGESEQGTNLATVVGVPGLVGGAVPDDTPATVEPPVHTTIADGSNAKLENDSNVTVEAATLLIAEPTDEGGNQERDDADLLSSSFVSGSPSASGRPTLELESLPHEL
eukprot:4900643-Pyramimonas_sp.AAC.1